MIVYIWGPLVVIFICLVGIGVIVARRWPRLTSLDVGSIPEARISKLKKQIVMDRLRRLTQAWLKEMVAQILPVWQKFKDDFKKIHQQARQQEKMYQWKIMTRTKGQRQELQEKVSQLIAGAEKDFISGELAAAEEKYLEAISFDLKNIKAYQGLARVYLEKKDYEHAQETLKYILKLTPRDEEIYILLTKVAEENGELEKARDYYLVLVRLNKKQASYQRRLGKIYQLLGDHKKARSALTKAVNLEPNNPPSLDALLEICIILKDKFLAERTYNNLKKTNPENQKLKDFKHQIEQL